MNLLLDTHTFLWFAVASMGHNLPQPTRELLEDKSHTLYLSVASPWEAAIKVSIGKLNLHNLFAKSYKQKSTTTASSCLTLSCLTSMW